MDHHNTELQCLAVCPTCGVKIARYNVGDVVHFSQGKPGTTGRLYARVCRYALERGKQCINTNHSEIQPGDAWEDSNAQLEQFMKDAMNPEYSNATE